MEHYARPDVEVATYHDGAGRPIPYGERFWAVGVEPPESAYSACTHPERFVPVAQVAEALVDHLVHTYDVERTDSERAGRRTVVLSPRGAGATLTVRFGDPDAPAASVRVSAGRRFEESWPDCGCDACDDDVAALLDDLEDTVLTIVEGGMSEWRSGPDPTSPLVTDDAGWPVGDDVVPWHVHVRLDGRREAEQSGWSAGEPEPVELPVTPRRWEAWPLRRA